MYFKKMQFSKSNCTMTFDPVELGLTFKMKKMYIVRRRRINQL